MLQLFIHRVSHSVINIIEQTQSTNLSFVPQTTKLTLAQPIRTVISTIKKTQITLPTISTRGHNTLSWTKPMLKKQPLNIRGQSDNCPAQRTTPKFVAAFDTTFRKCIRVTTVLSFQNSFQTQQKKKTFRKEGRTFGRNFVRNISKSSYLCNMLFSKEFACFCTI